MVSLNSVEEVEFWIQSVKARGLKPWEPAGALAATIHGWSIHAIYDRDAEYTIEAWVAGRFAKATVAPWVVDELAARATEVAK